MRDTLRLSLLFEQSSLHKPFKLLGRGVQYLVPLALAIAYASESRNEVDGQGRPQVNRFITPTTRLLSNI